MALVSLVFLEVQLCELVSIVAFIDTNSSVTLYGMEIWI